jgi:hypothetical protein
MQTVYTRSSLSKTILVSYPINTCFLHKTHYNNIKTKKYSNEQNCPEPTAKQDWLIWFNQIALKEQTETLQNNEKEMERKAIFEGQGNAQ